MIAAFIVYGIALSALIAVAAFAAERALGAFGLTRRNVWVVAIAASLLAPSLMIVLTKPARERISISIPSLTSEAPAVIESAQTTIVEPAYSTPVAIRMATRLSLPKWNSLFAGAWLVASLALGSLYAIAWARARRQFAACDRDNIAGETVVLANDVGPAVFGFLKPTIIVPHWLKNASDSLQRLVLEHERQHVKARDQLFIGLALLAIVIMPWNMPLWWQLRRLRFAIEVDCDARVLRSGANALAYGEALLHIGRRHLRAPPGAIALIEPPSDLEKRIRIMTRDRGRYAAVVAAAFAGICGTLVAVAAQIDPPRLDRDDLKLLPPRESFIGQLKEVARQTYPELFDATLDRPAVVKMVLNNDLSVAWSEKVLLPQGTTQDVAEAQLKPKEAVLARLHPDEPRAIGAVVLPSGGMDSPPVFVTSALHVFHPTRAPAAVERTVKKKYPELYDDTSDSGMLVIALMNNDGTIERAIQRPRVPGEFLIGEDAQGKALQELQAGAIDVGVMAIIGSRKTAPFRPTVLYAFRKSDDSTIDRNPMFPEDRAHTLAIQRALIERHFPEIADGSTNPHVLLWVLLDQSGEVVATGRDATSPDPLMVNLERQYPGAATARRQTTQLTALLGREMRDVEGQPILVTFAWLADEDRQRARERSTARSITLESALYRNGELVSSTPMTLRIGEPQTQTTDALRIDITAIDASKDLVDIGVVLRAPIAENGIDFAERWEIISQPMVRTRLGKAAVIEQGVRYPNTAGDTVWRIELKPQQKS